MIRDEDLALISLVLDGEASPEDQLRYAERMRTDEAFRAHAEQLRAIDADVRSAYAPAGSRPVLPDASARTTTRSHRRRVSRVSIAASVVLALALIALGARQYQRVSNRVDGAAVYAAYLANPTPSIVCESPEEFRTYMIEKLGAAVDARFDAPVALVGWRATRSRYERTAPKGEPRVLLARAPNDEPVVVIFQRASAIPPRLAGEPSAHMFSKRLGRLSAYEITPLDRPVVLDLLTVP
ncbi:MAG: hypothetical protein RBS39_12730 [Phycisphaerales bacterium]|nr:hypothetical protein [Phycisphaerales bacterium]